MKIRILNDPIGTPGFKEVFLMHYFSRHPELKGAEVERDGEGRAICDLTMHINGVEIDPIQFLNRLEECWDDAVRKAATELIEEKLSTVVGRLEDTVSTVRRACYQILGVEMEENW